MALSCFFVLTLSKKEQTQAVEAMSQVTSITVKDLPKPYSEINSLLGDLRRARISRGIGVTVCI